MRGRILFLIPPALKSKLPVERVAGCAYETYSMPNIFMLYLAAVARAADWAVKFKDFVIEKGNEHSFKSYLQHDDSDVYVFHTVNLSMETDLYAAELIRQIRGKDVFIIFVGPAPTLWPEKFCTTKTNIVIRGEPEATMQELLERQLCSLRSIKGISYCQDHVVNNPPRELIANLDTLRFPSRDLLEQNKYFSPKLLSRPFTTALISRNCPYKCYYCVPCSLSFAIKLEYKRFNKGTPKIRKRSPANVAAEFALLKKQGYKSVSILDDQFIWDRDWTIEVIKAIGTGDLEWGCATRVDHITDEIVKVMTENGCRYIDLGIESFNQSILNDIKKDLYVESIPAAIKIVRKYGICAKANVLIGASALESEQTVKETIKIIRGLKVDQVMYNIASPYPGTEFYDLAKKNGWLKFGDYVPADVQGRSQINYPGLSSEKMEKLLRQANRNFFLRPSFVINNLWRLKSFSYMKNSIGALRRKLIR